MSPVALLYVGLALLIPLGIIIGGFTPGGPTAVTSGAALLAFAIFWVIMNQLPSYANTPGDPQPLTLILVAYGSGFMLTLAAWIIALADMVRLRRWGRLMIVLLAGAMTFAATFVLFGSDYFTCALSPNQYACPPQNRVLYWLIVAGTLAGPAILLIVALRPTRRAQPDGLSVSRLDAADTVRAEPL